MAFSVRSGSFFSNFIDRFNDGVASLNAVSDQGVGPTLHANGGSMFHAGYSRKTLQRQLFCQNISKKQTFLLEINGN